MDATRRAARTQTNKLSPSASKTAIQDLLLVNDLVGLIGLALVSDLGGRGGGGCGLLGAHGCRGG